jgi:hypothetical protein
MSLIKKILDTKNTIVFTILSLCMSGLLIALCVEYRFFCEQSRKMVELRDQYKLCMTQVRKVLQKNPACVCATNGQMEALAASFPKGAHIVSSEDKQVAASDMLLLVNRESEYLKNSMITHLKEENLDSLLDRIDVGEWKDGCVTVNAHEHMQKNRKRPSQSRSYGMSRKKKHKKNRIFSNQILNSGIQNSPFIWPIDQNNFWISSGFGRRKEPNGSWRIHPGIDMAAIRGTPVKAAASGIVVESRYVSGYGNTVVLAHNKTYKTRYAHLQTICVARGYEVKKGKMIGTVGDTGRTRKVGKDASHLHFEVYQNNQRIDPLTILPSLV